MSEKQRFVVAMSGGVDSSAAAAILCRDYEVVGLHLTKFELPGLPEEVRRRDKEALASAGEAAEKLGIPLLVREVGARFDRLLDFFCAEYNGGRTPNPCVLCNVTIKWATLLEAADEAGARRVATGHYANIIELAGFHRLVRSKGKHKDQTYFLHRLTQKELSRTVFPLAELAKKDSVEIAGKLSIVAAERDESQEICFVGSTGYREVLESRTPGAIRPGEVVDGQGQVLGRHEGYQFYTIGQRRGLKIALGRPAYVTSIDAANGRVTLGNDDDLLSRRFTASNVNWICGEPDGPFEALVRIRYNHSGQRARVFPAGNSCEVEFETPVKSVTPGQAAVFYDGDEVVGGGWISLQNAPGS